MGGWVAWLVVGGALNTFWTLDTMFCLGEAQKTAISTSILTAMREERKKHVDMYVLPSSLLVTIGGDKDDLFLASFADRHC